MISALGHAARLDAHEVDDFLLLCVEVIDEVGSAADHLRPRVEELREELRDRCALFFIEPCEDRRHR